MLTQRDATETDELIAKVEALERALTAERDERRRINAMVRKERKAAAAIHARAERAEAAHAAAREELESTREAASASGSHVHQSWLRLADFERELRWARRPAWRKLLRRPPRGL